MKALEVLNLDFSNTFRLNDNSVKKISTAFSSSDSLKEFSFIANGCFDLSTIGFV